MKTSFAPLLLLILLGCGPKQPPVPAVGGFDTVEQVRDAAWARAVPSALQAKVSLNIDAPRQGIKGTARGGLLLHEPGHVRLDLFSPIGTPLLFLAADGEALRLFSTTRGAFLQAEDAESALRSFTGGAAGLNDVVSVLAGRLPFAGAMLQASSRDDGVSRLTFASPQGAKAEVEVDEATLTTQTVRAFGASGELAFSATYGAYVNVGGALLPELVLVEIPPLDMRLTLTLSSWEVLAEVPTTFVLTPPEGIVPEDLLALLATLSALIPAAAPPPTSPEPTP